MGLTQNKELVFQSATNTGSDSSAIRYDTDVDDNNNEKSKLTIECQNDEDSTIRDKIAIKSAQNISLVHGDSNEELSSVNIGLTEGN